MFCKFTWAEIRKIMSRGLERIKKPIDTCCFDSAEEPSFKPQPSSALLEYYHVTNPHHLKGEVSPNAALGCAPLWHACKEVKHNGYKKCDHTFATPRRCCHL